MVELASRRFDADGGKLSYFVDRVNYFVMSSGNAPGGRATDPYAMAYQIDRLMRRMNAGVEARAPIFDTDRIGPIGGMILLTIAELQPTTMQRVAETMARDKAQLSRTISSLERRGLVARATNEDDQRSMLLSLTDKGDGFVGVIKRNLSEVLSGILEPLDDGERELLLGMLSKL